MYSSSGLLPDLHDGLALVQCVLVVFMAGTRLPRVFKILAQQRTPAQDALLLNADEFATAATLQPRSAGVLSLRVFQMMCCAALFGIYVALLVDPEGQTSALVTASRTAAAAMWAVCMVVVLVEIRARAHSGRSLRVWWILNFGVAAFHLYFDLQDAADAWPHPGSQLLLKLAGFAPSLLLALAAAFEPDTPNDRAYARDEEAPEEEKGLAENVEATASFASRVTFSWCTALLRLGRERALEHSDLFALQTSDATRYNEGLLAAAWSKEAAGTRRSYLHAWHAAFGAYFWRTGLLKLVNDGMMLMNPILINTIVAYIDGTKPLTSPEAILCALAMLGFNTVKSLASGQYFFRGFRLGLRTRVAVGQHVYSKALSLVHEQRNDFGVGAIVSYMQIDASKIADSLPYLHLTWSGPMLLIVATFMLYSYLGPAGFAGLGVMVFSMPLNGILAKRMQKYVVATMKGRDARVKFTNELLQGVRIIKLFAWEDALLSQLREKREAELRAVKNNMLFSGLFGFVFTATPLLVTAATFVIYAALGNTLTAAAAFTSLSLFNILRFPLTIVPMMITRVIDLTVVNKRLSKFFNAPRAGVQYIDFDGDGGATDGYGAPTGALTYEGHYAARRAAARGAVAVEMDGCVFRWPEAKKEAGQAKWQAGGPPRGGARGHGHGHGHGGSPQKRPAPPKKPSVFARKARREAKAATAREEAEAQAKAAARPPTLSGMTCTIPQGAFVGVCGPVGCGKSTFLSALLGDVPRLGGRVATRGRLAFCAQEPWIQNLRFRENILFGQPFDARLYARVLSACALDADLRTLEGGDACEIGERGINLSGGQKARVALARACYAQPDVLLLDDILSAVDAEVAAHLVHKCLLGLLAELGTTVVLVTHHTHWLAHCAHIIEMADGGTIARQGRPADLNWAPRGGSNSSLADAGAPSAANGAPPNGAPPNGAPPNGALANGGGKHKALAVSTEAPLETARAQGQPATPGTAEVKRLISAQDKKQERGKGQMTSEEDRERGVVKRDVWVRYGASLGLHSLVALLSMHAMGQALTFGSSWWLGEWARDAFGLAPCAPPANATAHHLPCGNPRGLPLGSPWFYILIYVVVSMSAAIIILVRAVVTTFASLRAGRRVHDAAVHAVFVAPMSFFDTTPLGRILNRFSGDVQKVDVQLATSGNSFFNLVATLLGTLVLLVLNSWYIVLTVPVLGLMYLRVASYYRNSARELQRLDSTSKSPIYAAFSEALGGSTTIQAFDLIGRFEAANCKLFDKNLRAGFVYAVANRWLSVRLEFTSNILLAATALLAVVTHLLASDDGNSGVAAGMAGLALSYAPGLTDTLNFLIRQFTTLETDMVSAERLFAYAGIDPEESRAKQQLAAPVDAAWPHAGAITFSGVRMRYREGLKPVIDGLDLTVRAGEKVGLVGRTGAGKSSVLVCLYRIVELDGGSISIDGRDIAGVPLRLLRARLSIIPQDPVLFTGTMRHNLDPFGEHSDEQVCTVLEQCGVRGLVDEHAEGLARQVEEKGGNLSMGQRQLVCMGRALLKRSRVLVLDEATANIDLETDELIQNTLRTSLGGVSVITIAHRLDTIMHCDRVVVMADGAAAESGPPLELKEKPGGRFAELWASRS